ncbi:MAG: hypothetical protein A2912_05835 [Candidatus Buchananbacteria bacterium RIFCSPLOWO2_01_FULL_40_23b]|uniref:Amidohydrolase-related domain-containing protein n=1 Tax=Candidatus Buchananbacteria bacterium RIFCSPLOWO2_01_FULL_40_23b TaxID=1797544 RepID=A0A1G1YUS2_9BACT|nr:MAG: hypothetical protein A2912_05835 [Candidatus Buchananbacteria bacterium RIFCSPLOWO2_01_FULL_40_23b]
MEKRGVLVLLILVVLLLVVSCGVERGVDDMQIESTQEKSDSTVSKIDDTIADNTIQQKVEVEKNVEQINETVSPKKEIVVAKEPVTEKELSVKEKHWKRVFEKAFAEVDCPKARDPMTLPEGYYRGPMFDAHIHMQSLPDGTPGFEDSYYTGSNIGIKQSINEWVCMLDTENTSGALVFFAVWEPIVNESVELVRLAMEKYPGRFVPFIMPPENDGSPGGSSTVDWKKLDAMLNVQPGLFRGYGEIGLYGHSGGAAPLPPDSARLQEIYPIVRKHKLVVYFHLGEGQKEAFEKVLSANPDITFIWHGDQLADCGQCDGSLRDVTEILEKHPNVYYGVDELYGDVFLLNEDYTKEEFIAHFKNYEPLLTKDLETWKEFIEKHPNQVLWDTDRGVGSTWSVDPEVAVVLNDYSRAFIGRLDKNVQEKFAYKNAQWLFAEGKK